MSRLVGLSVAAGLLSALLFLAATAGMFVSSLPLALAGLGLGLYGAAIGAAVGCLAVLVGKGGATAVAFGLASALPALVISRQALLWRQDRGPVEWYPAGGILAWLAAAGVVAMGALALVVPFSEDGIEAMVHTMVEQVAAAWTFKLEEADRARIAASVAALLPGMVGVYWLVMSSVNGALAQGLLTKMNRARRPNPAYAGLELPDWMMGALAAAILVGAVAGGDLGYFGRNAALLLVIPFGMQGTAAVHRIIRERGNHRFLFVAFYAVFVITFQWMVLPALMVMIGLGQQLLKLQRRFAAGSGKED